MHRFFKIFKFYQTDDIDFRLYKKREIDFKRLAILNSIVYVVVFPLLLFYLNNSEISKVYYNTSIIYLFLFPFILILSWLLPAIRNKLYLFVLIFIYTFTLYIFLDLVEHNFQFVDVLSFFVLYTVCIFLIQQFSHGYIYIIYVVLLTLYSFIFIDNNQPISKNLFLFYILSISFMGVFSIFLRNKTLKSINNINKYLRTISRGNKFGFFIMKIEGGYLKLIDYDNDFTLSILEDVKDINSVEEITKLINA
ncbi:MAG TPA: hypothetical protein PKN22_07735, partial [Taishania sp.]|nr:hypothetical protein [Taishania sp.]